jgi:hypothetical protein
MEYMPPSVIYNLGLMSLAEPWPQTEPLSLRELLG